MEFYHVTPVENVDAIMEEGLKPGLYGGVNLCTNWPATAGLLAMTKMNPATGEAPEFALFEVDTDGLDVEEFWDGSLSEVIGNHIVEGGIDPDRLTLLGQVVETDSETEPV